MFWFKSFRKFFRKIAIFQNFDHWSEILSLSADRPISQDVCPPLVVAPADCCNYGKWGLEEYIWKGFFLGWFFGLVMPGTKDFFPALAALVCQVKNCVFLTIYYFPVTGSKPCRQLCSVACLFICVSGTNQVGPPIITLINGLTRVYSNLPHSGGSSLARRSLCRSC